MERRGCGGVIKLRKERKRSGARVQFGWKELGVKSAPREYFNHRSCNTAKYICGLCIRKVMINFCISVTKTLGGGGGGGERGFPEKNCFHKKVGTSVEEIEKSWFKCCEEIIQRSVIKWKFFQNHKFFSDPRVKSISLI